MGSWVPTKLLARKGSDMSDYYYAFRQDFVAGKAISRAETDRAL